MRAGGGDAGGDSSESGERLGDTGAAQERSNDSNCARLEERDNEVELVGEESRSRRRLFAGHAHSRSDSLSHSEPVGKSFRQEKRNIDVRGFVLTPTMTMTTNQLVCSFHLDVIQNIHAYTILLLCSKNYVNLKRQYLYTVNKYLINTNNYLCYIPSLKGFIVVNYLYYSKGIPAPPSIHYTVTQDTFKQVLSLEFC